MSDYSPPSNSFAERARKLRLSWHIVSVMAKTGYLNPLIHANPILAVIMALPEITIHSARENVDLTSIGNGTWAVVNYL